MTEEFPNEGYLLKGIRVTPRILALVVFLALLPVGAFQAMSDMLPRHPYQELAAAKRLEIDAGKNIVVAGTFPFLQRYVGYRYHHLKSDFGNKGPQEAMDYFRKLRLTLKENKADYIIVGSRFIGLSAHGIIDRSGSSRLPPAGVAEAGFGGVSSAQG